MEPAKIKISAPRDLGRRISQLRVARENPVAISFEHSQHIWRELFGPALSPFVFPSPRNPKVHFVDYKTAWRTAVKKAGFADRRIYDLRSTFASRANVCHATGLTVAHLLVLGHASTQILPTYVRPVDENTRALIEAMDAARKNQRAASDSVN